MTGFAPPLLVGIDVGSTRVKAGVIDFSGRELTRAAVRTQWRSLATGGEAHAEDFLRTVRAALAQAMAGCPSGEVVGVGVTSLGETAILLAADGTAVGPAVAWFDERARPDFEEMRQALSAQVISSTTGLRAENVPTVATLRRLMRTHPELRHATHVLSVAEWLAHRLGGEIAAEPSLASRTGAFAVRRRDWWTEALEWAGLPREMFPPPRDAGEPWGRVHAVSPELRRLDGAALTVAGHDQHVAAVGSGSTRADQVVDSCGTAEALLRAIPAVPPPGSELLVDSPVSVGCHALPGQHSLIVSFRSGIDLGLLLSRLRGSEWAGRTSLDDAALCGDPVDTAARQWREGIAALVDRATSAMHELEACGGPIAEVRVTGGWIVNPVLRALKAEACDELVYPAVAESGVRGAALFAGLAAGVYASAQEFPLPDVVRERRCADRGTTQSSHRR